MNAPHTAWIVEDLASSRVWLAQALEAAFPGIALREADCLAAAQACVREPPDLALIDLGLPDGSGIALIEALRAAGAPTRCVVATVFDDDAHLFPALRAGAEGYVLKDQPPAALALILRGIATGQPPLSPSIARRLLRHFQPPSPATATTEEGLTARENDVLRLVAKGFTVPQVAEALGLSRHTTAGYLKDIYRKLRVGSRAEATLEAARRGLVSTA